MYSSMGVNDLEERLIDAVVTGNAQRAKQLIAAATAAGTVQHVVNAVSPGYHYGSALHIASKNGLTDIVSSLLAAGANINAYDNRGRTPICYAAAAGKTAALQLLLSSGASVDHVNTSGETALHGAVDGGPGAAAGLQLLIAAGACIEQKSRQGQTALHVAAEKRRPTAIRVLLQAGADLTAVDAEGNTALNLALRLPTRHPFDATMCTEVLVMLLAHGAAVNARNRHGRTALHFAATSSQAGCQIVQALLAAGADVNARSNAGQKAMFEAAQRGHAAAVGALLAAGAEVDAPSSTGRTPLFEAAQRGHAAAVEALLAAGAAPDAACGSILEDAPPLTPLSVAAAAASLHSLPRYMSTFTCFMEHHSRAPVAAAAMLGAAEAAANPSPWRRLGLVAHAGPLDQLSLAAGPAGGSRWMIVRQALSAAMQQDPAAAHAALSGPLWRLYLWQRRDGQAVLPARLAGVFLDLWLSAAADLAEAEARLPAMQQMVVHSAAAATCTTSSEQLAGLRLLSQQEPPAGSFEQAAC